jgi:hypothetical protein
MNAHRQTLIPCVLVALGSAAPLGAQQPAPNGAPVLEITATDYAFRAPASAAAGWTTIRFTNEGEEPHFVFMSRLPEGRTIDDYERELSPVFARAWEAVRGGASPDDALQALTDELPAWFPDLGMVGGPGLAAAGRTTHTVLRLEPGNYVLECYVKTADGKIHYMEGMIRPLTVTAARTTTAAPAPDVTVTLSNDGIELAGDVAAGTRVFAVHWKENPEQGFGHSAHLARLEPDTRVEDVVAWMNWFSATGLAAPAPAEFIGGLHFMPTGETAYFIADLEPGRYLLVSESTAHLGVHREFIVR